MNKVEQNISSRKAQIYNNLIKPNLPKNKKEWFWFGFILLLVLLLLAILFNQLLGVMFKVQLVQHPCELCESYGNHCYGPIFYNGTVFGELASKLYLILI